LSQGSRPIEVEGVPGVEQEAGNENFTGVGNRAKRQRQFLEGEVPSEEEPGKESRRG